jgi:glycosyltransferase involved in cell wall biosynthesis
MRICLVYDCLYPHTIGGAERWYRELGGRLARDGHEVTYLTLRQWDRGFDASYDGVRVVEAGPRMALYDAGRKRRMGPPVVFGLGVLWHLMRHGRSYDVVHTASFPYFSVLAIGLLRPLFRFRVVVDWHELWTRDYWREYLGRAAGAVGWCVQRLCVHVPQRAFAFSRLHARRLEAEGLRGGVRVLEGEYSEHPIPPDPVPAAAPLVVFAGRHIPEKRAAALVPAMALLHERRPDLRCEIYGDGPARPEVLEAIERHGAGEYVEAPGFVDRERLDDALRRALCMVLPSRREGYGLVVVEASARGVPSVVVRDPDNAATELVDEGENGFVAESASPEALAAVIERVADGGRELRERTAQWYRRNARRLSIDESLDRVAESYGAEASARS